MDTDILHQYADGWLPEEQIAKLEQLADLYTDWNAKINVISRRDIDNLYLHHVVHSLAIAKFLGPLVDGTRIMDFGCGGGLPGIPLAIVYPQAKFHLIDRIGKKIRVAQAIAEAVGLTNLTFQHGDVGECHEKFDYIVSRGVMPLNAMLKLLRRNISPVNRNAHPNGLVCLKGADIEEESTGISLPVIQYPVTEFFNNPFYEGKAVVYVPMM